jgi:hypothetical protein
MGLTMSQRKAVTKTIATRYWRSGRTQRAPGASTGLGRVVRRAAGVGARGFGAPPQVGQFGAHGGEEAGEIASSGAAFGELGHP